MLKLVFDNILHPFICQEIIDEYTEVLLRDKFNLNKKMVKAFLLEYKKKSTMVAIGKIDTIKIIDIKDQPFYNLFVSQKHKNIYLITGNKKHFPNDDNILTAKEFLDKIKL